MITSSNSFVYFVSFAKFKSTTCPTNKYAWYTKQDARYGYDAVANWFNESHGPHSEYAKQSYADSNESDGTRKYSSTNESNGAWTNGSIRCWTDATKYAGMFYVLTFFVRKSYKNI